MATLFETRDQGGNPTVFDTQTNTGFGSPKELFDYASGKGLLGLRTNAAGGPEAFNPATGQGFGNETEAINFLTSLPRPNMAEVKLDVSPKLDAKMLDTAPVTIKDIQAQLNNMTLNRKKLQVEREGLRQQTLEALKPTQQETDINTEISSLVNQARQVRQSFEAGVDKVTGQAIPMPVILGQAKQLENQANRRLSALSDQQGALTDTLQLLQGKREAQITQLNALAQFIQEDMQDGITDFNLQKEFFDLQMRVQETERQQQKEARDFAFQLAEAGVSSPFFALGGTMYKSDGTKAYSTPEEFFADAGVSSFEEARARGLYVDAGEMLAEQAALQNLDTVVIESNGRQILINSKTGETIKDLGAVPVDGATGLPGEDPQLYAGLTPQTATAVRGQVGAFKSEPVVQNFAVIQEGRNFASSLSNTTTNPADDQALIYSLAKALDPGSVVREGEYATAQKYSQSWIQAYGKSISQAILGTGFLSAESRKNIKQTIEQKYKASKTSYDNLYNQYISGIGTLTGRSDGEKFLRNYSVSDDVANYESEADALGLTSSGTYGPAPTTQPKRSLLQKIGDFFVPKAKAAGLPAQTSGKVAGPQKTAVNQVINIVPAKSKTSAQQNIPLIENALRQEGIYSPQVLAYALATIEHETAGTFRPIEEYGGRQQAVKLGYGGGANYFGRGFIQLTHLKNYQDIGRRLGLGDKLAKNPSLALQPEISAKILAAFFKDKGVVNYLKKNDFIGARKPVNGTDKAKQIATRAQQYLKALS